MPSNQAFNSIVFLLLLPNALKYQCLICLMGRLRLMFLIASLAPTPHLVLPYPTL